MSYDVECNAEETLSVRILGLIARSWLLYVSAICFPPEWCMLIVTGCDVLRVFVSCSAPRYD